MFADIRKHWQPVLTLLLIAPLMTELLSNNLTFSMLFLPPVRMLFLMTIGYGFPVLLVRDFAVRHGYGLGQLVVLGLAYGIWNEGVQAKTLLRTYHLPIDLFDFYGFTFHIAVPWALMICCWHAMHSVIYPILIVHFFFPSHRHQAWLGRAGTMVIALITLIMGALIYFNQTSSSPPGSWLQLAILGAVALAFGLLADHLPRTPAITPGGLFHWTAIRHGFCFFLIVFALPLLLAYWRIPVPLYITYFAALIGVGLYRLSRLRGLRETSLLLFMLGDEICLACFSLIGACGMYSYERMAASLLFLAVFLGAIGWLRQRSSTGQ